MLGWLEKRRMRNDLVRVASEAIASGREEDEVASIVTEYATEKYGADAANWPAVIELVMKIVELIAILFAKKRVVT